MPRPTNRPHRKAPAPALEFARWIVWEDPSLVVVDKPAGVLSQGGEGGHGVNLVDLARAHYGLASIGVLHRLDRNVSGLVMLAKAPRAARALSIAMQSGAVEREYEAIVQGAPRAASFEIDAYLRKDPRTNEVTARAFDSPDRAAAAEFKPARTVVNVRARWDAPLGPCARLALQPITGRSHQLRAHLAFAGLPIVGDPKYGVAARGIDRPLLHAVRLAFAHPVTRAPITVTSRAPWSEATVRALARP